MKKKILLIGTGGTIACEITKDGLKPEFNADELIEFMPRLKDICNIDCICLFNIDSTSITPAHWCQIAESIRKNYADYDGFVITHGTDTMAYTAAALSYLVQNPGKPVILTGSQRPIGFDGSDAKANLRDSFICACSDKLCGVTVVFDGKVISATRAKKTHTKSYNAFESMNFPYIAHITDGRINHYITLKQTASRAFFNRVNENVAIIKIFPSMKAQQLNRMLEGLSGAVIESYGTGGMPIGILEPVLESAQKRSVIIAITTQAEHGGSDLCAYAAGCGLKKYPNIIEGFDITTEAALAKLMWILSDNKDIPSIKRLFYTPVQFDIFNPDYAI